MQIFITKFSKILMGEITMRKKNPYTIEYIKSLGKNKSQENFDLLLQLYQKKLNVEIKREIVSSIGRQDDLDRIYNFLAKEAFKETPMEVVYQMFRTCLYNQESDLRFKELCEKMLAYYDNEVMIKMYEFKNRKNEFRDIQNRKSITKPLILYGDCEKTLLSLPRGCTQLIFTSPPYYNAREYSDYHSYKEYLNKMKKVFVSCHNVLEDGRFLIVNVSPVITKRPGREFESVRYPLNFDFHRILEEAGFTFIDEIQWIKPEPCVPNRNGGYEQTRKPLSYKPNCITESIMVYRKKANFLLDVNVSDYKKYDKFPNEKIDSTNCWYISPTYNKNHPAVFPEELCRRILKYYSFEGDTVLDPFAGSGTFGKVALRMKRIPILCEINKEYTNLILNEQGEYYDLRKEDNFENDR